jgi:hypothetical protein
LRRAAAIFLSLTALALGACVSQEKSDAPAQQFVPPGAQLPLTISGHLDETIIDFTGDETVTIMIDNQIAAIGGFQSHKGVADASFVGAFRGAKVTVHCTGSPSGKGYVCEVQLGAEHAATLMF